MVEEQAPGGLIAGGDAGSFSILGLGVKAHEMLKVMMREGVV
jgi:hypothetical protein